MQSIFCPFCMSEVQSEICPSCGRTISYAGDPTHLPVGHVLEDKRNYILGAALGQGGFGVTYIAWDEKRKQKVAIKEYFPTYCSSRLDGCTVSAYRGQEETYLKGRERFLDEARMLKSLSDLKSVVNVLDFFEANNSAYLVMEYLDGLSLKDYVQKNGKLPAQQFLNQLKPLMADMEKMHRRGVIHRDIAPDNIIMLPDGRLKLIDFGAARSYVGDKSMTVVVKKGFAPVEQYMRKGSNASTDVYALAATIYYCITGIVPPDSAERQYGEAMLQSPIMLGADLLPYQESALEQALEIQPRDRLQSIEDFLKALFNAPRAVPTQPAVVASSEEKPEKTIKPKQAKTKKPKTVRSAEKKKASGKTWLVAAVLALCVCIGIVVASMDWPAPMETVEQLATEQTEPVDTQPEETLSPEEEAYNEAVDLFYNEEYGKAAIAFAKLGEYRDAKEISLKIWDAIAVRDTVSTGYEHTVALQNDGTVIACGNNSNGECDVSDWTDIVAVSAGTNYTMGLKADGTVVATGKSGIRQINVDGWKDIVAIDAGQVIAYGLRSDGTVLTTGNDDFQKEVSTLMNIVSVDALDHWNYFCDVEPDGTLIELDGLDQVKYFSATNVDGLVYDNFEISQWQDIRELADGFHGMARLKSDGTVGFEFYRDLDISRKFDTEDWQDITSISMGTTHLLGLKADGTVMATGDNGSKQCAVDEWTDIVSVKAGQEYSVGLKSDGTLVTTGSSRHGKRLTSEWTDIRLPADREALLAEIRIAPVSGGEPQVSADGNDETEADKLAYNKAVQVF